MPHGRPMQIRIRLRKAEAVTLEAWSRSPTIRVNQKRRGRLIQQVAQGWSVTAAAVAVGMSRNKAYHWIACFQAEGLAGLADRPRAPAPKKRRAVSGKKTALGTALARVLTPEDRATLLTWWQSETIDIGRSRRAELVLLLAAGHPVLHVARRVGISPRACYKWAQRYQEEGLRGLYDRQASREHLALTH